MQWCNRSRFGCLKQLTCSQPLVRLGPSHSTCADPRRCTGRMRSCTGRRVHSTGVAERRHAVLFVAIPITRVVPASEANPTTAEPRLLITVLSRHIALPCAHNFIAVVVKTLRAQRAGPRRAVPARSVWWRVEWEAACPFERDFELRSQRHCTTARVLSCIVPGRTKAGVCLLQTGFQAALGLCSVPGGA